MAVSFPLFAKLSSSFCLLPSNTTRIGVISKSPWAKAGKLYPENAMNMTNKILLIIPSFLDYTDNRKNLKKKGNTPIPDIPLSQQVKINYNQQILGMFLHKPLQFVQSLNLM